MTSSNNKYYNAIKIPHKVYLNSLMISSIQKYVRGIPETQLYGQW